METKPVEDELVAEAVRLITAKDKDPEALRQARARADQFRKEMDAKYGVRNIVLELLRETRDGE
jgi:hypothetical protein